MRAKRADKLILALMMFLLVALTLAGCGQEGGDSFDGSLPSTTASDKDYIPKEDHYDWDDLDSKAFKESKFNVQNGSGESSSARKPAGILDKIFGLFGQGEKQASRAKQKNKAKEKTQTSAKGSSGSNGQTQRKTAKEKTDAEQTSSNVTVTIECKALIGNSEIDEGTKSLIPPKGYILRSEKIRIKKGETVYEVLKKAAKEGGIVLNTQQTAFGVYIAGIAGIEEKAAGGESGWKYSVNGKFPGRSCDNIKLSPGDRVVWTYVLRA